MSIESPTGLDPIEEAILVTLSEPAPSAYPYLKSTLVLAAVQAQHGFAPEDAYRRILALCRPWLTGLRLIDFHGNRGDRGFDAAEPRYTEVRLTPLGERTVAGIAGSAPALPVGCVLGDTYKGGTRPPLDPGRLVHALRALAADPTTAVGAYLSSPAFPAGCAVDGDLDDLWNGRDARLRLTARIDPVEAAVLRITALPPRFSEAEVVDSIMSRRDEIGLADISDLSTGSGTDIRVQLATGDTDLAMTRIAAVWGVTDTIDCRYPQPLGRLLWDWIETDRARLDALDALTT